MCANAYAQEQCLVPPEAFDNANATQGNEIVVRAQRAEIKQDTLAEFQGKVEISGQSSKIEAEQAFIDKESQLLKAEGNILYQDEQILVSSDDLSINLTDNQLQLNETEYQMRGFTGRGKASQIALNENQGVLLKNVSFSTCPANAEDWKIEASSIELEPGEIRSSVKHTKFYVKGVPIFYLPYFSFPVTSLRQSGLLYPKISSSDSTGISYEQPIYWNILPNIDATFSPRYMTKRGLQLKSEFRYLVDEHAGELHFEYIDNDKDAIGDPSRYFYRFTHRGYLSENWSVNAEFNGLSDDNYIVDLGSDFYNRADTHLFKTVGVNYYGEKLDFSAQFRDFAIIGDHPNSYRALPEIKLDYQLWESRFTKINLHSELTYFDNGEANVPKATRLHLAPTISVPFQTPWAEFLAETTLLHTEYHQENTEGTILDKNVSRTLGQVRLLGSMAFERKTNWFGKNVTQTLEPKAQYLYTSFENQNNIGFYDTTRLLNDYVGLFRGQEFTGLDRISDNNQVTLGVTSRILDENNREQFRLSLGQIFYFESNRVLEAAKEEDRSALAAELDWSISSKWFAQSEIQVSTLNEKVERSSLSLEYRLTDEKLIQFNHRFVRDLSGDKIDQLGVTASWPIAKNWQWVGRYYRDMNLHRTTESYTGVQYDSCCWALQLVWQRHLSNRFDALGNQSVNEYDSGINFKFIFKGMGRSSSVRSLLKDGLYGYQQPYFLNH